jgi:flavin reductase (DIM6/NTAB) family NADH-FMN oxidoreductase RutF
MQICPDGMEPLALYKLMTGVVVPRPIAWVTTLSEQGVVNLAPFSCFSFLSSNPPILGFTVGKRRGRYKDTANNIRRLKEFVVHIADESMLEALHLSADEYLPDVSEAEVAGLAVAAGERVAVPRLTAAPVAMECALSQTLQFGRGGSEFFVGEVQLFHLRDGLYVEGKIDSEQLRPIGRLAGPTYATLGKVVRMRPNRGLG